ncbi:hypothetical protein E2C01_070287 [Portunus trituberculatus]|uniref:Uncharacterized protein n=1 Tax=Portunus trituberculatus TaxID=210409 RepID=A0A5B7I1V6_PORTR|nr:hypothetical protein [Portunus trituberculatus]
MEEPRREEEEEEEEYRGICSSKDILVALRLMTVTDNDEALAGVAEAAGDAEGGRGGDSKLLVAEGETMKRPW